MQGGGSLSLLALAMVSFERRLLLKPAIAMQRRFLHDCGIWLRWRVWLAAHTGVCDGHV